MCTTVVYVLLMIFGLSGNILTILVVWLRPYMRSSTYLYLSSMSVSDMLILLLLPLEVYKVPAHAQNLFVHAHLLLNTSSVQGVQSQQSLQMILNAGVAGCICWLGVDCAPNQPSMPSPEGNTRCQIKFSFFTLQALVKTISGHSVLRSIFYCFLCTIKL